MFYGDRDTMRQMFVAVYFKRREGRVLDPMEAIIGDVIAAHPEYHPLLEAGRVADDYRVEDGRTNPFLHMAMHIAIREQVDIDRPAGIRAAWRALVARHGDAHAAEHRMLDCLAETLLSAQAKGVAPDEQAYLEAVQQL